MNGKTALMKLTRLRVLPPCDQKETWGSLITDCVRRERKGGVMRTSPLLVCFVFVIISLYVVWKQCDAATYDATGTWSFSLTNNWINGVCYWNRPLGGTIVITQTGDNVQVVDNYNGTTYTGTVSGTNYNTSGSYSDEGGTTTITINITLTSNTTGSGSWTVHWTNGIYSCDGGADISITKSILSIVHVDFTYAGTESGIQTEPFNTLAEAINAVAEGGVIIIKSGITSETFTGINKINKNVTIKSFGGTATIGKQ